MKVEIVKAERVMLMHRILCCVGLSLLVSACAAGCGQQGPETADVHGVVTLDGEPLPKATVLFVPPGGRPSVAETNDRGEYRLRFTERKKGAIPGVNRVEITTFSPSYHDDEGQFVPATPERVPMQYNKRTTLEFEVEPNKSNTADFHLESKGTIAKNDGDY